MSSWREREGKILELEHQLRSKSDTIIILQERQESNLASIDKLKQESNEAEQYSRRTCVRVYGIPENPGEDTDKLVLDLAREKMDLNLEQHEIDRSHRVGAPAAAGAHSTTGRSAAKPRPIIVKCTSYRTRERFLKNRRKLKGTHIGIEEDLTVRNRTILYKAKEEVKKNDKIDAAWSTDGRIILLLKATNGRSVRKRIWSVSDLSKI